MSRGCGDPACEARLAAFEATPGDPLLRPPCTACLAALVASAAR